MIRIDMHIHSNASDGTNTIQEVIEKAKFIPLEYISITDHDTVAGLQGFCKQQINKFPKIINGIELTCGYSPEIHILGYFIDIFNPQLNNVLHQFREAKIKRSLAFLRNLRKDYPSIRLHDIMSEYKSYSKKSIIQYLLSIKLVENEDEAKDRFFSETSKYYIPPIYIEPAKAIEVIKCSGGIASLAHLCRTGLKYNSLTSLVAVLKGYGLDALEVYNSIYVTEQVELYKDLAARYKLLSTGGSDYHGDHRKNKLGSQYAIPTELITPILNKIGRECKWK